MNIALPFCVSKISIQTILRGHITTFSNLSISSYTLFITFFLRNKLLILLMVTLHKNLCKNVILRGDFFVFLQVILQFSLRFIVHSKWKKFQIWQVLPSLVFCNYVVIGGYILKLSKTISLKLIFHLQLSYQLPYAVLQDLFKYSTDVKNRCI